MLRYRTDSTFGVDREGTIDLLGVFEEEEGEDSGLSAAKEARSDREVA